MGPREGRERTLSIVEIEPTTFESPLVHRLSFKAEKRKKTLGTKDPTWQEINITCKWYRLTLIVLMMVLVLSFLFVSLLCGAVLARNSSIIFSEFRSFSSSSSLSTCFSCFEVFCSLSFFFETNFLEEVFSLGSEKIQITDLISWK